MDEDSSQFAARCEALKVPRRGSTRIGARLCLRSVPSRCAGGSVFEQIDVAGVPHCSRFSSGENRYLSAGSRNSLNQLGRSNNEGMRQFDDVDETHVPLKGFH